MSDIITERLDATKKWLHDHHPEVFTDKKHLDEGTPERAYWHYGYAMALHDVLQQMKGTRQ